MRYPQSPVRIERDVNINNRSVSKAPVFANLSVCGENYVGYSGSLDGHFYVVSSQDVRTFENQGSVDGEVAVDAIGKRRVFSVLGQHSADERFPRRSGYQGETERLQILKAGEQRIILLQLLAKTEAGIEGNPFATYAALYGRFHSLSEFALDQENNIAGRR